MQDCRKEKSTTAILQSCNLHAWLFWSAAWLAIALVAVKAFHLGLDGTPAWEVGQFYLRALAAISYADVLFVALFWCVARAMLALCGRWRAARLVIVCAFTGGAAFLCLYAVLNVVMFPLFGGFLTYPLLALVGDIRMLRSSVTTYLRPGFVTGLVCLPIGYVALVWLSARRGRDRSYVASGVGRTVGPRDLFRRAASGSYLRAAIAGALAMAWIVVGADAYGSRWTTRADRAIAENPEWVFVSSWWRALRSGDMVEMSRYFDPADLADFEPIGARRRCRRRGYPPPRQRR